MHQRDIQRVSAFGDPVELDSPPKLVGDNFGNPDEHIDFRSHDFSKGPLQRHVSGVDGHLLVKVELRSDQVYYEIRHLLDGLFTGVHLDVAGSAKSSNRLLDEVDHALDK